MTQFVVSKFEDSTFLSDIGFYKISFGSGITTQPSAWVPSIPLAIGLVLIANKDVAIECGVPTAVVEGCRALGVVGAHALGSFLLMREGLLGHPDLKKHENTFELNLSESFKSDRRAQGANKEESWLLAHNQGVYWAKHSLDALL